MVGMSSSQAPDNFMTAGRPDLCEFSLLGRVFRLTSFGKLQKQAILLCHSFPDKTLLSILTKNGLGYILSDFFHKVIWHSACIKCQCVHATNSITYLVCINHRAANVIMYICTCAYVHVYMCTYVPMYMCICTYVVCKRNRQPFRRSSESCFVTWLAV
jgi:hypothetical protein